MTSSELKWSVILFKKSHKMATRVLLLFLFPTLYFALNFEIPGKIEYNDIYYDEAMELWHNYNSETTDLSEIKRLLE